MGRKLIPGADIDFIQRAEGFAANVSKDPAKFALTQADADAMTDAAVRFRAAYQANFQNAQSRAGTLAKNEARAKTKEVYTRLINKIRVSEDVSAPDRISVGIQDRPGRLRKQECPQEPPRLSFVRALHAAGGTSAMHELSFRALEMNTTKPPGAVRLELFVDLIAPGDPVPQFPGENHAGRPWYLRSYTRSPIKLAPPMSRVPMLVVYWGRWADSTGNVGPWSATVVSRIEGWSPHVNNAPAIGFDKKRRTPILADVSETSQPDREAYIVAVMDARYVSCNRPLIESAQREPRQLEGPTSEAA